MASPLKDLPEEPGASTRINVTISSREAALLREITRIENLVSGRWQI